MTLAAFRRGYGQSGEVAAAGSQVVLPEGQQPIVVAITVRRQGLQLRVFEERLLGERESELGTTPVPAALLVREPTHHHVQICRGDGTKRHAAAIIEGAFLSSQPRGSRTTLATAQLSSPGLSEPHMQRSCYGVQGQES